MSDLWAYNSNTGAVTHFSDPLSLAASLHTGTGWHGPFATKQNALDYYTHNKANNPGWAAPTDSIAGRLGNAVNPITDPLGKLNLGGWFIRIGEILLGLVLLGVGVAKITGTTNVISQAVKAKI